MPLIVVDEHGFCLIDMYSIVQPSFALNYFYSYLISQFCIFHYSISNCSAFLT